MAAVEAMASKPAADLRRARMLINGDWVDSASGESYRPKTRRTGRSR